MRVLVITSGGLDSTVTYYRMIEEGHEASAVFFDYGQRHCEQEYAALCRVVPDHRVVKINLPDIRSSLLGDGEIPSGEYGQENMRSTVVPFRNGIMLANAVAIAENDGYSAVAIGAHAGDHELYPDCTEGFITAMSSAAQSGTYGNVVIVAPFVMSTKRDIVEYGREIGIGHVMAQTYSCYKGGGQPCGVCSTCRERAAAFAD